MNNDSNTIRFVIGADHRGYAMKEWVKETYKATGYKIIWIDVGAYNAERSDYPLFAQAACKEILAGNADYGILLCGTGIGMAIAANRFEHVYAGVAWSDDIACLNKEDDNVNILVIPSDFVSNQQAISMINKWFFAHFKTGRYQERLILIDKK